MAYVTKQKDTRDFSPAMLRANFTQDGIEGEGMFSADVVSFGAEFGMGYYMAYNIVGITASKGSLQDWEDTLSRSLGSIEYSQEFVSYAMNQSDQTVDTSQQLSQEPVQYRTILCPRGKIAAQVRIL